MGTEQLFSHKTKSDFYIEHGRRKWGDLYKSMQYFLENRDLTGEKILEVGCAAGGLYNVINERFKNIKYTGLDISAAELADGRKRYPKAEFVHMDFMKNKFKTGQFDTVISYQVVNHQAKYRDFVSELARVAKKRVIFDTSVRYEGQSVVDLDSSFVYYHGSGKRNHHVIINFFELFNYLHTEEFNAKKIEVFGYKPPTKTSAFIPMPKSKIAIATFCLEKHDAKAKVDRFGAREEFVGRAWCEDVVNMPGITKEDF